MSINTNEYENWKLDNPYGNDKCQKCEREMDDCACVEEEE